MLNRENIGKRIAFYRREKGITQRGLADDLHISYQAVSKWESGKSLPTVEMLYEISNLLNVTVDALLNEDEWRSRGISYQESGLDTRKLHALKEQLQQLVTKDGSMISANYADACLFRLDTAQMKEPVYSCITCVPGSKEKLAKEYGYNRQICEDVASNAMNFTLQHGMKPVILRSQIVCGNYSREQLRLMAEAFQKICEENEVCFSGMEISSQPVNYGPTEYELTTVVLGVQDREKLLTGSLLSEGDVLIGIRTEGIEGTSYPFVKIMLDKNSELYRARIDENRFFLDELMRANTPFTREINALREEGYLHMAFRIGNSLTNWKSWKGLPEGLGVCIDLSALPVLPLYKFLFAQNMIGEDVFHQHFHMGIGMAVAVPENRFREAMEIIGRFSQCWRIGQVESDRYKGTKVWSKGRILWQEREK